MKPVLPTVTALALIMAMPAFAQLRSDDARAPMPNTGVTKPGTPVGTGAARGSDENAPKPVPGPGATTGDSSQGVSPTAPQTSMGSAPPSNADRAPDMERIPAVPPHGGSSSGSVGGGANAPARSSGESAPAGRTTP